jgi:hypothetical protein
VVASLISVPLVDLVFYGVVAFSVVDSGAVGFVSVEASVDLVVYGEVESPVVDSGVIAPEVLVSKVASVFLVSTVTSVGVVEMSIGLVCSVGCFSRVVIFKG